MASTFSTRRCRTDASRTSAAPISGCSIVKTGHDAVVPITIVSDFDQLRDHWVKSPLDYLTAAHISPDGERGGLHRAR